MSDKAPFIPEVSVVPKPRSKLSQLTEVGSLLLSTLVLLLTFVINGLSSSPMHAKFGFNSTIANVSRLYSTQITPADWTFAIWGIIYILQTAWIIYGWTFTCRQSIPRSISPLTYVAYTFVNLTNIAWIYVWDNLYIEIASIVLFLSALSLYVTLGSAAYYLYKQTPTLSVKSKVDLQVTRILVLNGIAIYATWVSIATLINLTTVLQYFTSIDAVTAGTISLSVLAVEVLVYFILENTFLDKYLRFVGIVYPVIIWALSGDLAAHWGAEGNAQNPIIMLVLLVASVVLFLVRIILWVIFSKIRPLPSQVKTVL